MSSSGPAYEATLPAVGALAAALGRPVTAVSWRRIGVERGFAGTVLRGELCPAVARPPATVVAKVAGRPVGGAGDGGGTATPGGSGLGREAAFYAELAGPLAAPAPGCWYAGPSRSGTPVVVLEDLAGARPGDALAGAPVADVARVLARMAPLWRVGVGAPLATAGRLPRWGADGLPPTERAERYGRRWRSLSGELGSVLPVDVRRLADQLADALAEVLAALGASSWQAVLHGDLHLDNLLFRTGPDGDVPVVLDWERVCVGSPGADVFPFLAMSLAVGDHERHALRLVDELVAQLERDPAPSPAAPAVDDPRRDLARRLVLDGRRALLTTFAGVLGWLDRPASGIPREAALRAASLGDGRLVGALRFWEVDGLL